MTLVSSVGASDEFKIDSFAHTNRNSVIALAMKRGERSTELELAELPLPP